MNMLAMMFLIAHLGTGALNVLLALPLIGRRIPPNGLYGFRTWKTLSNEQIWYDANAYSGRCLKLAGAVTMVAGSALYACYLLLLGGQVKPPETTLFIYIGIAFCIFMLPIFVSVVASYRYLQRIVP